MTLLQNNWQLIREFYDLSKSAIMAERKNEWGIDPYAWDRGIITLTPIECWLWHDIRAVDVVLYPQYPVFDFFVDFANPKAKVAIECDGQDYHLDKAKDDARDLRLSRAGWKTYRISGKDCRDGVGMEYESKSAARTFIKRIAENHHIKRM